MKTERKREIEERHRQKSNRDSEVRLKTETHKVRQRSESEQRGGGKKETVKQRSERDRGVRETEE